MEFEIGNPWHWLFLAVALPASARSACKAFFAEFDVSRTPFLSPVLEFWIALCGTCSGWFALWHVLPAVTGCAGSSCPDALSFANFGLVVVAATGISGLLPEVVHGAIRLWISATGDSAQ